MTKQEQLLGVHPVGTEIYDHFQFLDHIDDDLECCYRELTIKDAPCNILMEKIVKLIVHHHHSQFRVQQLKANYAKLGFAEYATYIEENRRLPRADKVMKGNITEVLLTQYVEECLGRILNKVFKLRYNPNVDQAIKGDDTLMVDYSHKSGNIKVYLGEAKFRETPSKGAIEGIEKSLGKEKLPLSYTFMVDEIAKENQELAQQLDSYIISEIKAQGDMIYTGFFFSNENVSTVVKRHLSSDNPKFILISLGITEPTNFINNVFTAAEKIIQTGASQI